MPLANDANFKERNTEKIPTGSSNVMSPVLSSKELCCLVLKIIDGITTKQAKSFERSYAGYRTLSQYSVLRFRMLLALFVL